MLHPTPCLLLQSAHLQHCLEISPAPQKWGYLWATSFLIKAQNTAPSASLLGSCFWIHGLGVFRVPRAPNHPSNKGVAINSQFEAGSTRDTRSPEAQASYWYFWEECGFSCIHSWTNLSAAKLLKLLVQPIPGLGQYLGAALGQ